jgi:ABC-type Zn uptake system ZnuABC Zn-binding protein ZnuA
LNLKRRGCGTAPPKQIILLSWNCRGVGSPRTVRDLFLLVKENNPSILFLMETNCKKNWLESLRVKLGFAGLFEVYPVGRSGRLALFWRDNNLLEIQNFSRRHINAIIKHEGSGTPWKLSCFYGHPDWTKRHESWALLCHLKEYNPHPWLVIGDFNEIVAQ